MKRPCVRQRDNFIMQKEKSYREKQAEETKLRIKNCSIELFKEKGYYNTSIEDIAKKADASIGGFYHHFKNKEDIIIYSMELLDDDYSKFFNNMINSQEYVNKNYILKIKDIIIYIIKVICAGGDESVRIAYSYIMKKEEIGSMMSDRHREYFKIITFLIKKAKAEGLIRNELNENDILNNITIIIRGIVIDWSINRNAYNLEDISSSVINLFLKGIVNKDFEI